MKIAIDARMLYWTGVGRYIKALLENLQAIDHENEYLVLVRRADWKLWEPSRENFRKVEVNIDPYSLGEQLRLPKLINGLKPDLVHFTAPNTPLLYRGRRVVSIHDLTLLDFDTSRGEGFGKMLRGLKRLPFRLVLWHDAKFADRIVTISEYVKGRLVKRFRVPQARIDVTLLAADPNLAEPEPIGRLGVGKEFLLYVGNFYPYKNVGATIEALKLLAAKQPELKLVIVGKEDYFRKQLEAKARELGLGERVVFTGFVSDGELVSLYRAAKLYLYPSLSEGFGLQGLEAMAQGCPVLAARASCLPEVYADAAVYFNPRDVKDQAEKIADLLGNEALRERLRKVGYGRLKQFSWRRTAEQTLAVYRKI